MVRENRVNYYNRHIGDYLRDAAHLSMIQDGAYTRLLDLYYTREGPIPDAEVTRLCRARGANETRAIRVCLKEFFVWTNGLWRHKRCDRELSDYAKKCIINIENGKKGGRPKTQSVISGEPKPNPEITLPVASSQKPLIPPYPPAFAPPKNSSNGSSILPPGFLRFWSEWPRHHRKTGRAPCAKFWNRHACELIVDTIVAAVKAEKKSEQWTKEDGAYIPMPATWLHQERWETPPEEKPKSGLSPEMEGLYKTFGITPRYPTVAEVQAILRDDP